MPIIRDRSSRRAPARGAGTAYSYGAFGEPKTNDWTGARFRYTGQIALPEARLYHYKARVYDPHLSRFLQTDPLGRLAVSGGGGFALYAVTTCTSAADYALSARPAMTVRVQKRRLNEVALWRATW